MQICYAEVSLKVRGRRLRIHFGNFSILINGFLGKKYVFLELFQTGLTTVFFFRFNMLGVKIGVKSLRKRIYESPEKVPKWLCIYSFFRFVPLPREEGIIIFLT